jgi:hypothetical protein
MTIELFDETGKKLASGYVVPDGGKIRVPHLMMDGAPPDIEAITKAALADAQKPQALRHSPGQVAPLTDADRATREKALDARDKRLVDAWKSPPAVDAAQIEKPAPTTPTGSAADRRDARLEQAWRN